MNQRSVRVNTDYKNVNTLKWSPDNTAFITNENSNNCIEVYKLEKKEKDKWIGPVTKALTFSRVHQESVVGIGIASNGKFIMSCSEKNDLVIMDLKGNVLGREDTYLSKTACAKISPCGHFVFASGIYYFVYVGF